MVPNSWAMRGKTCGSGTRLPSSQPETVTGETPTFSATCCCVIFFLLRSRCNVMQNGNSAAGFVLANETTSLRHPVYAM